MRLATFCELRCLSETMRAGGLVEAIRARIQPFGGVELKVAPREAMREPDRPRPDRSRHKRLVGGAAVLTPQPRVVEWLSEQPRASVFTTTITRGEILYGIRVLPAEKRRDGLWDAATQIFDVDFEAQVLTFDSAAADEFAEISAVYVQPGGPLHSLDTVDCSGITRSRGAQLPRETSATLHKVLRSNQSLG